LVPASIPSVLGVIPARGGSKRVPRKNLRLVNGEPLLAYTIRAAQQAKRLTDWVVSTEDQEIANLALSYGAFVVQRPESLAHDDTTSGAVVRHALDWMEDGRRYDMVVLLHPTSPIRDPKHIDQAIDLLWNSELNYLASVQDLPRKGHRNLGMWTHGHTPSDGLRYGRFDASLDSTHMLNASIYAIKRDAFIKHNSHVWTPCVALEMDRLHSLDIDEELDLKMAELFLGWQQQLATK
jgi:CMP-N,N'-diacetyllegionaminic acid synthase